MALVRKYLFLGLLVSFILGGLFAFLGVYNTNTLPYFNRFVFWTATMLVGFLSAGLIIPWVVERWLPKRHIAIQLLMVVIIISFPVTLVLAAFDSEHGSNWSTYVWLMQYRYVIVISAILMFGGYAVLMAFGGLEETGNKQATVEDDKQLASIAPEKQFLKRLPHSYRNADLYAVASEDHYLRVYTSLGEELILMRLSDACLELESAKGMQTHRSWWVADAAIKEIKRAQGKRTLILKSGLAVPVSRSFDKAVKDVYMPVSDRIK